MKNYHGWKEGVLSEDLHGFSSSILKGSKVRYKRYKTIKDSDGFRLTEYEWHYMDLRKPNLLRTIKKVIEGEEKIIEPVIKSNYGV